MGLTNAGIAQLAVLVAPVGIVHVVSHHVVNLLCGSHLGTALAGRAEDCRAELMGVVYNFVGRQIIGEGTVVHALDPVVAAKTCAHVGRK